MRVGVEMPLLIGRAMVYVVDESPECRVQKGRDTKRACAVDEGVIRDS